MKFVFYRLMRNLIITIIALITFQASAQKNKWSNSNDSTLKENIRHFSEYCKSLSSNKPISKEQLNIDKSLIETANSLYNSIHTIRELDNLVSLFNEKEYKKDTDSLTTIHFYPYTNGNLRLIYDGVFRQNKLIRLKIQIATNTKLCCKMPEEPDIQFFDPIYIRDHFIKKINFPITYQLYNETIKTAKSLE